MNLRLNEVFAEAGAIWRAERGIVMPVAGLFYFLPSLCLLLLLPAAQPVQGQGEAAAFDGLLAYAQDNAGAIVSVNVIQLLGAAVLLTLFVSKGQPTLGEAMRAMLARSFSFVVAAVMMWTVLTFAALLVVPALYLIGRFFLATAAIASGAANGPVDGIAKSVQLTRGRGWQLFGYSALIFIAGQAAVSIAGMFDSAVTMGGGDHPVLRLAFNGLAAAAATFAWVMTLLVKVVVYRRLTNGI